MLDILLIAAGILGTLLGLSILLSGKVFFFWRDKVILESDTSSTTNFLNRWIRGTLFLLVGFWILYVFLLPHLL